METFTTKIPMSELSNSDRLEQKIDEEVKIIAEMHNLNQKCVQVELGRVDGDYQNDTFTVKMTFIDA